MDIQYNAFWRKNYEAMSAFATGSIGAFALYAAQSGDFPQQPYYVLAAAMTGLTLTRVMQAVIHARDAKVLDAVSALERIDEKGALKHCSDDNLWLGDGFVWSQRHVQKATEIMNRGHFSEIESLSPERGSAWLHKLEPKRGDVKIRWKDLEGHTLIVGTTGSGKTRMFDNLLFQMGQRKKNGKFCPIIFFDPKGDKEILSMCLRIAQIRGEPENVYMFHPGHPEYSCRMNPLRNFQRSTEVASRVLAVMQTQAGDPFAAVQWKVVNTLVEAMLVTEDTPSFSLIRKYIDRGYDELIVKTLTAYLEKVYTSEEDARDIKSILISAKPQNGNSEQHAKNLIKELRKLEEKRGLETDSAIDSLIDVFEHDPAHLAKMISSIKPVLAQLTASNLKDLISADPGNVDDKRPFLDMSAAIEAGSVIYIGLDCLSDRVVGSAIGSIILAELASISGEIYNHKKKEDMVDIYMLIDELAEVLNQPLIQLLNKGRGAGFLIAMATQAKADLAVKLASVDGATQALANCNNTFSLRVIETDTQKYVTDRFPKTLVHSYASAMTSSSSADTDVTKYNVSMSERQTSEQVEIFPPNLLTKIPDLEYIASVAGGKIIKGRLPLLLLDERPEMKDQVWVKKRVAA